MDAIGVIHEDIGDVFSESNTDASVVVYLHELGVIRVSISGIGLLEQGEQWRTLIAGCEGGARVVQS